jgi:hypothetical protein
MGTKKKPAKKLGVKKESLRKPGRLSEEQADEVAGGLTQQTQGCCIGISDLGTIADSIGCGKFK